MTATRNQKVGTAIASVVALTASSEGIRQLSAPFFAGFKLACRWTSFYRLFSRSDRDSRRFFVAPSAGRDAIVHDRDRHSVRLGHFCPRSVVVSHMNDRPVSSLAFSCGPCAIFRRVALRVVLAFYRQVLLVSGIFCPFVKDFKGKPFVAHGNSFPAVVLVRRVAASSKHVAPACVNTTSFHSVRGASFSNGRSGPLASARHALSASQVASDDNALGPTGASAPPQSSAAFTVSSLFDNDPLAKNASGHVDNSLVFHFISPMRLV